MSQEFEVIGVCGASYVNVISNVTLLFLTNNVSHNLLSPYVSIKSKS